MSRPPGPGEQPEPGGGGRLSAPSALRNRDAIAATVARLAPARGRALELASGTGEHVLRIAPDTPGLTWQPTDLAPDRLASIAAWLAAEPRDNVLAPRMLDACAPGWAPVEGPVDLILLVNLLHLIPDTKAAILLREIAAALAPGGIALIYGPFLRDGAPTSDGDAAFDASLRARDPAIGYKDVADVAQALADGGLDLIETVRMPANNLVLAFQRPG